MKQWLRASIFWRLYGVELAAVTLAWLAFGAVTFLDSRSALQEELDRRLQMLAQSLAIGTSLASSPGVAQALGESLRALQIRNSRFPMEPSDLTYRIWKADGTLIAGSRESPSPVDLHADTIPPGQRALRSGWILSAAASPGGQVIAVVGESRTYIERLRHSATRKLLYPYIVLAVALAGVAWVALRVGLRPLRQLAAAVAARPENDLSPLSPRREYVELAPLVSALNGTVARIRRMIEAEREFFADAAHELRTPLAAVGAQAHVVVHETEESNRLTAAKALNEGIERASNVLRRLLVLARLDAAPAGREMRQTDVVELIEDVAAVRASHATTSGHEIHAAVRGPLIVRCSADDLRMALDCLVDNALKHTPSGSHIRMAADDLGSECALSVTDDGPGISAENRERAFRRFERLGRTDHEGSGLGLAIVRRVAELHGGRVLLQAGEDGRGCRFEIRIPLET